MASLKPDHLRRYKDVVTLLLRHGSLSMLRSLRNGSAPLDSFDDDEVERADPEQLASDLESLGPTFVKLGQLLASRADLLPQSYLDALSRLQDECKPVPFEHVEGLIREELEFEIDEAFKEFDRTPIASASIAQVHRARLGNGRPVAVKVQRPGLRRMILKDLDAIEAIAALIDAHTDLGRRYAFRDTLEEVQAIMLRELDFRAEAHSLTQMGERLGAHESIVVPRPIERLTSSRVLTMDFVEGIKISTAEPVALTDIDGTGLAEQLCEAYLEHMLIHGSFHADPHPGNVLLIPDGRLALIDLGMTAHLSVSLRRELIKLVAAIGEGDASVVTDVCVRLGTRLNDYDRVALERRITRLLATYKGGTIEDYPIGRMVLELGRAAAESGIRPPAALAIVGKTMLHLAEIGSILDPSFRVEDVVRRRLRVITAKELMSSVNLDAVLAAALEVSEFARQLPRRVNTVLEALADRQLEVRVRAFDEHRVLGSIQRVGTRITLGLVLAALIVGAALIMRIEARYTLLGYPALAVALFVAAVTGGIGLAASIFIQDIWRKR